MGLLCGMGMLRNLPPHASVEWTILPFVLLVALIMAIAYAKQLLCPREHVITISKQRIHIIDSIYGKWRNYQLDPDKITDFVTQEDGAMFIMSSLKAHALSSMLGIHSSEIRQTLKEFHPHIKTR